MTARTGRVPMIHRRRPWTPDARKPIPDTDRYQTVIRLKRACNGCGVLLGDATDEECLNPIQLADVRGECPFCNGQARGEQAGGQQPGYWIEVHPTGWPHHRIPTSEPVTPGYRSQWVPWRGPGPVPPSPYPESP